jgi:nucleoside-diphosphate-sugar epimerase
LARRAFLLGGSGQCGLALVPRLLERGWEVVVGSRGERPLPPGVAHVRVDRDADDLGEAVGDADVVVDFVAYEPRHGEQLLSLRGRVRSLVVLSSVSVYADAQGRTLDEARDVESFPDFRGRVTERVPTVGPGDATYSTKKVAIERALLGQRELPVTIIRPAAIHGPGSTFPREWYFAKRVLDGRRYVVLAGRGLGRFHTTATANLAELLWLAAERPGRRVVNCADPDPPTVLEVARTVAAHLGHEWTEVLRPDHVYEGVGATPWSVPRPFLFDTTEAEFELGYRPVTTWTASVGAAVDSAVEAARDRPWLEAFPRVAQLMANDFDYAAEDEYVARLTAG